MHLVYKRRGGGNLVVTGCSENIDENAMSFSDARGEPFPKSWKTELSQNKKLAYILFRCNLFQGASMMFSREILSFALPFPQNIKYHDMWIALIGLCHGRTAQVRSVITKYRGHKGTVTERNFLTELPIKPSFIKRLFRFEKFEKHGICTSQNVVAYCENILERCSLLSNDSKQFLEFTVAFYAHYKSRLFRLKNLPFYFQSINSVIHYDFSKKQNARFFLEYLLT